LGDSTRDANGPTELVFLEILIIKGALGLHQRSLNYVGRTEDIHAMAFEQFIVNVQDFSWLAIGGALDVRT